MDIQDGLEFTQYHHALLFACICKALMEQAGEPAGGGIIRNAVRKYGEQRGLRMALRAKRNSHPLTMENYLVYGEWALPKGEMDFRLDRKMPHACLSVFKCPWHEAWKANSLLDYGCYFCKEIDEALVRGFNPELELEIRSTLTNGGEQCCFIFKEARLSLFKLPGLIYKKKIKPGTGAIMPWEYHSGHLYKTLDLSIRDQVPMAAERIMEEARMAFAGYFSQSHVDVLKSYASVDFEVLPD